MESKTFVGVSNFDVPTIRDPPRPHLCAKNFLYSDVAFSRRRLVAFSPFRVNATSLLWLA